MRALLIQNGLTGALKPDEDEESSIARVKKIEIMEKAHSALILCLGDKPLREVSKEKITIDDVEDKNLSEHLDTFNGYVDDLEDLDVKLEDDDKALMLMNALPKSLENFKDDVMFGMQDQISYDDMLAAVKTKILRVNGKDSKTEKKTQDLDESLNVKFKKGNL
ncbi:hypothetical protein ACS0TY_010782 [Phlomoides rotata]